MFPPGGHMGPPLGSMGKIDKNTLSVSSLFFPHSGRKNVYSTATPQSRSYTQLVSHRRGGPTCPPVVGILNSLKQDGICIVLLTGGHTSSTVVDIHCTQMFVPTNFSFQARVMKRRLLKFFVPMPAKFSLPGRCNLEEKTV